MAQLKIPLSSLPPLNNKKDAYFVRYRLITSDRNSFSYWSNIYQLDANSLYTPTQPKATISSNVLSITWEPVTDVSQYDVWVSWDNKNYEQQTVVTKELTSSVATLTTGTNNSYATGDKLTVSGIDTIFDGTYTITGDTANTVSYSRYYADIASSVVSPVGIIHPAWTYYGRVSTTSFATVAINTHASVRIYRAANPVEQNSTFLLYEKFDVT